MFLTVCANPSIDSFWSVKQMQKGRTNRSQKETFYPGGKGIHTALALNELGQKVKTLGLWGGPTGQWLQDECQQRGVQTIGPIINEWTRFCLTIRSAGDWNDTEMLGHGPMVDKASRDIFKKKYTQCISKHTIDAVLISGSLLTGLDNDLYAWMIQKAHVNHIRTFLDASGDVLNETISARPFAIHVNQKEGQENSGKKDPADIADWLADYCKLAAVTDGAHGLYLRYQGKLYHACHAIDKDKIFSTIGSGDCLLAGLCLASSQDKNPAYWAQFATACGSANCINPPLGMLKAEDVTNILPSVTVEELVVDVG